MRLGDLRFTIWRFEIGRLDMNSEDLKKRTKNFALNIIKVVENFSKNTTGFVIGKQIVKSATSIGANYRSACRAKSKADFIAKISIVEEEADETLYWLELAGECGLIDENNLKDLLKEANELVAIFTSTRKTAKSNNYKNG